MGTSVLVSTIQIKLNKKEKVPSVLPVWSKLNAILILFFISYDTEWILFDVVLPFYGSHIFFLL